MEMPTRVGELYQGAIRAAQSREHKRLRLAVTIEEYREIREYCLANFGEFCGRLANIPLVIDVNPDESPLLIELQAASVNG